MSVRLPEGITPGSRGGDIEGAGRSRVVGSTRGLRTAAGGTGELGSCRLEKARGPIFRVLFPRERFAEMESEGAAQGSPL